MVRNPRIRVECRRQRGQGYRMPWRCSVCGSTWSDCTHREPELVEHFRLTGEAATAAADRAQAATDRQYLRVSAAAAAAR